ncbi:MAG: hypothetical protein KF861_19645 [Planctomycetaceae bacterium]|nr:hypothetical protein [Planctomycetaceae bacterium]
MVRMILCGSMLAAIAAPALVRADSIELVNGDVIRGTVVSVDERQAVISSELLGQLRLDRSKLKSIRFGDQTASVPSTNGQPQTDQKPSASLEDLIRELTGRGSSDDKAKPPALNLDELFQGGNLDLGGLQQLQKSLPLLSEPEVQKQFQKYMQGLMSGEMTLDDLRNDAADVRNGLKQLQKELGPRGQAFDGYLDILDSFLNEAAPSSPES